MRAVSGQKVIALARECLGTPFRHQGRVVGVGIDCIGVAAYCASKMDLVYNDENQYSRSPREIRIEDKLDSQPCLKRVEAPLPGDMILFRVGRYPQHIAIYAGATIVHAFFDSGKVVEQPFNPWAQFIVAIYRFVK